MQFKAAILEFESYLKLEKNLSKNSIEAYGRDVKKLYDFLSPNKGDSFDISEVEQSDIEGFLAYLYELQIAASSQARILSGIKSIFGFLHRLDLITKNPTDLISGPNLKRKLPDTLSFEEIESLLNQCDLSKNEGVRNRAIIEMLYSCGVRVSELTNLKTEDLHFDLGFIKVTGKGNKERFVPIGKDAIHYTKLYIDSIRPLIKKKTEAEKFIFLNRRGGQISRIMIFIIIKDLATKANIQKTISPHTFRHSFASHMVDRGADLRAVQELLGHESITTTEIYTHLQMQYLQDMVEMYHPLNQLEKNQASDED